jgi:hypothetical protein
MAQAFLNSTCADRQDGALIKYFVDKRSSFTNIAIAFAFVLRFASVQQQEPRLQPTNNQTQTNQQSNL